MRTCTSIIHFPPSHLHHDHHHHQNYYNYLHHHDDYPCTQRLPTPTPSVRTDSFASDASNYLDDHGVTMMMMTILMMMMIQMMLMKTLTTRCQACPQSSQGRLGQASDRPLNPPLVFVIDTTKSVKPDKDSIFNLTGKVTGWIMKDRINIISSLSTNKKTQRYKTPKTLCR